MTALLMAITLVVPFGIAGTFWSGLLACCFISQAGKGLHFSKRGTGFTCLPKEKGLFRSSHLLGLIKAALSWMAFFTFLICTPEQLPVDPELMSLGTWKVWQGTGRHLQCCQANLLLIVELDSKPWKKDLLHTCLPLPLIMHTVSVYTILCSIATHCFVRGQNIFLTEICYPKSTETFSTPSKVVCAFGFGLLDIAVYP